MPVIWRGEGGNEISMHAFEQLEKDSDRAAGLVAGAIVERRLEEAIKVWLVADKAIRERLFHPSGPLGSFSVKIDLAYLMGIVSKKAKSDLVAIKNVRNDFAHNLDFNSFDIETIKSRCASLRLIDSYVGDGADDFKMEVDPSQKDLMFVIEIGGRPASISYAGAKEELTHPRQRFIQSAKLISFLLGKAAQERLQTKPYL